MYPNLNFFIFCQYQPRPLLCRQPLLWWQRPQQPVIHICQFLIIHRINSLIDRTNIDNTSFSAGSRYGTGNILGEKESGRSNSMKKDEILSKKIKFDQKRWRKLLCSLYDLFHLSMIISLSHFSAGYFYLFLPLYCSLI